MFARPTFAGLLFSLIVVVPVLAADDPGQEFRAPEPVFLRGDVDGDGVVQIADAMAIVDYLFGGRAEPECLKAADVDDDGRITLGDSITLMSYLFGETARIAAPHPSAGTDPTADSLPCTSQKNEPQGRTFYLFDNGLVCIVEPCPSWTAVSEGFAYAITHVDVSALELEPDEEQQLLEELADGQWHVRAVIEEGPTGPGGVGTTLRVLELTGRVLTHTDRNFSDDQVD